VLLALGPRFSNNQPRMRYRSGPPEFPSTALRSASALSSVEPDQKLFGAIVCRKVANWLLHFMVVTADGFKMLNLLVAEEGLEPPTRGL
jgi:hypothetical protein